MKRSLICYMVFMIQSTVQAQTAQDVAKHTVPPAAQQSNHLPGTISVVPVDISKPVAVSSSAKIANLAERFTLFHKLLPNEIYSITIAADVPDDDHPYKVYVRQEPGHVFVILEQKDTINGNTIAQVWGFYPVRPVSSIFFKNVRCELNDNGKRKYDASITRRLTETEFGFIRAKAVELTQKKYNINRYNCYDYAIELFNSIPGIEKLPVTHIKFPFIFGRGGSPCGLYRDLQKLKANNSGLASAIRIESGRAPASYSPPASRITDAYQ
jgi:hypothetical protein